MESKRIKLEEESGPSIEIKLLIDELDLECSITGELMIDPVMADDNFIYERHAIETWLLDHDTSPKTRERISKTLRPVPVLKKFARMIRRANPESTQHIETDEWVYDGEVLDGKPHGEGVMQYKSGKVYTGNFIAGLPDGVGVETTTEGVYTGRFAGGLYHGQGTMIYSNRTDEIKQISGEWVVGAIALNRTGEDGDRVTVVYKNGDVFKGIMNIEKSSMVHGEYIYAYTQEEYAYKKYNGLFDNNKFTGTGTLLYNNGDSYEGRFENGKFDGNGKYRWSNGDYYKGEWDDGHVVGFGELVWIATHISSSGEFIIDFKTREYSGYLCTVYNSSQVESITGFVKNGIYFGKVKRKHRSGNMYYGTVAGQHNLPDGKGMFFESHGVYEGEFSNGKYNGQGKYTGVYTYEGSFKDDELSGFGVYVAHNGEYTYTGEFANGNFNGKGVIEYKSGNIYDGDFKDDKYHGKGTFTYGETGDVYVGEFEDDVRSGYGVYTGAAGFEYKGMLKNGFFSGQGTYTYETGTVYKGEFKEDEFDGYGVLSFSDGAKYTGTFINGNRDVGEYITQDGVSYKGKWLSKNTVIDDAGIEHVVIQTMI